MLIKSADDKSKRLALLEDLQRSTRLDRRQRDWLREELHRTKRGLAGERDAAHYLDNYLKGRDYLLDHFTVADAYLVTVINWTMATPPIEL